MYIFHSSLSHGLSRGVIPDYFLVKFYQTVQESVTEEYNLFHAERNKSTLWLVGQVTVFRVIMGEVKGLGVTTYTTHTYSHPNPVSVVLCVSVGNAEVFLKGVVYPSPSLPSP